MINRIFFFQLRKGFGGKERNRKNLVGRCYCDNMTYLKQWKKKTFRRMIRKK